MLDTPEKPKRTEHRPITITVESVGPMPTVRKLPHETQMTLNLKGNRELGEQLIAEIQKQIEGEDFFAIMIEGVS